MEEPINTTYLKHYLIHIVNSNKNETHHTYPMSQTYLKRL